ncbi:hypothetical protein C2S52_012997 [Perilla frutescens var. hirtella]|uniref:Elongin-A n=1 Tax=Perilla frutescens var. hirtella TaxID=608512 RepID=A0AAD4JMY9_PERFH|nr:hypothetical protein C2S51_015345 [Perilla frutescens var. frutescens]KAH6775436.1 hypothetical protein C2S52_012997 [Perilla frutescens var. hirtella]KAH6836406.1 hypothetical protein C2S53_015500 [Perilla frutescens var. hirtella]
MKRKIPSLVDLCVQLAIDNVRYLGDVGETDSHLLDRILCHCTLDQLTHIENSTVDRDLSPVTDKLWKKYYKDSFGEDNFNTVVQKMRQKKVTFKWKQLYEAKLNEREEATQKSLDRIKLRYQEEDAKKRVRQVQLCSKVPPSSKKRSFWGGAAASNIYNTKSNIMKKAKMEFINSREVKNIAAMKTKVVHRTHSVASKEKPVITSGFAASSSSSSSNKLIKPPFRRRF